MFQGLFIFSSLYSFEKDKQAKSKLQALIHVIYVAEIHKHWNKKHLHTRNNMTTEPFFVSRACVSGFWTAKFLCVPPKQAA